MHKAAICAIVKNEGRYIREWLAYHVAIGFDHFYIYDNESDDDTREALEAACRAGVCTVSTWKTQPDKRNQVLAYQAGLSLARDKAEWLLFLDADEFVNLKKHRNITAFLASCPEADAIGINWRCFGSSNLDRYEPGLLMDRFRLAAPPLFGPNHLIKTIAKTAFLADAHNHTHPLKEGARFVNADNVPLKHFPAGRQDIVTLDSVQINHYFTKSKEEWEIKRLRGKADFPVNHPDRLRAGEEFGFYDKNDEHDDTIRLWRDETIRTVLRIFAHI